ncbi:MAG TPA: hypothetical protein PKN93_18650, partial [Leptospiraceae bacterium]|nr:hypothetical protein [Leptospiraceae bacterium]
EKYPQFAALETQISSALSGSSPVSAVLAVMEKEENVRLLYLFEGYNESFQADGVLDADGQKMADELRRFADDLRAIRLADLGQSAVSRYAAYVESSVSN